MKRKAIVPLLLGLGVGLVTVKLAVDTIRKAQAGNSAQVTVMVVQAKQDIAAFEEITAEMVTLLETADSSLVPATERIETLEEALGRVSAKAIPMGSPVLKDMLAQKGTPAGMVGRIPSGFRAVSVKIDESTSVAFQLKPGDWVDVTVVMDVASGLRGRKETIAETILQRIQVAAVGNTTRPAEGAGAATKIKPAKSATLFVREADVPKLHLASTRGKITLSMRGDEDSELIRNPAVANLDQIISGQAPEVETVAAEPPWLKVMQGLMAQQTTARPQPPKAKLKPHTVQVVRGTGDPKLPTNETQITFKNKNSQRIINVRQGPPNRSSDSIGGTQ